jgi:hypothetical protein
MFVITPVTCLTLNQTSGKSESLTGSQHVIIWALHNLTARHSPPSAVFSGRRMQSLWAGHCERQRQRTMSPKQAENQRKKAQSQRMTMSLLKGG